MHKANSIKPKKMYQCDDYYYFDLIQYKMNNEIIYLFSEYNLTNKYE